MADPQEQRSEFSRVATSEEERLRFVSLSFDDLPGTGCRAKVSLAGKTGRTAVGVCEGRPSLVGKFRSAAGATAEAIERAVEATPGSFEILDLRRVKAFDTTAVIVAVAVRYGEKVERMVGFCVVDPDDPTRAAPLAVLNGTNRFVEAVLAGRISWKKRDPSRSPK